MKFLSQEKTAAQRKSSSSRDVPGSPYMWRDLALIPCRNSSPILSAPVILSVARTIPRSGRGSAESKDPEDLSPPMLHQGVLTKTNRSHFVVDLSFQNTPEVFV